jgi:hypothetical protein
MSEAGTLLSDLDSAKPNDRDLVDSILSDINQMSPSNPLMGMGGGAPPPPAGVRMPVQTMPSNPMTHPNATDPAVATAHLIGRDHPTEADFQRMMMAAQGPLPFNAMAPQMQQTVQPMQVAPQTLEEPKKNWQGQWIDELKQPIAVAIVVFVMTLPAFNLLVSHYAPNLLRPGGDLNTIGMLVRAGLGGIMYWVLQRVISPLLSI